MIRSEIENDFWPALGELTEVSQVKDFLNSSLFSVKALKEIAQENLSRVYKYSKKENF